jgi:hypothetical protein
MADLLFVVITVAFFIAAVGYVRLCDRIIGPEPPTMVAADTDAAGPAEVMS